MLSGKRREESAGAEGWREVVVRGRVLPFQRTPIPSMDILSTIYT